MWQKHVVATSTNGIFKINFFKNYTPKTEWAKLMVCKNCLFLLNYKKFRNINHRQQIVDVQ
jgi:hypothetical protein